MERRNERKQGNQSATLMLVLHNVEYAYLYENIKERKQYFNIVYTLYTRTFTFNTAQYSILFFLLS